MLLSLFFETAKVQLLYLSPGAGEESLGWGSERIILAPDHCEQILSGSSQARVSLDQTRYLSSDH